MELIQIPPRLAQKSGMEVNQINDASWSPFPESRSELNPTCHNTTDLESGRIRQPFIRTSRFWIVLFIGQILSFCFVAQDQLWNQIPEDYIVMTPIRPLQYIFNYLLLAVVYTSYTVYKQGFKGYGKMLLRNWWKYLLLSFFDVEGYYFVELSSRYSASLVTDIISFSTIFVILVISFCVLRVRYYVAQILSILVCCGGVGVIIANLYINGDFYLYNSSPSEVKGDILMFFATVFFGLFNIAAEFLLSTQPIYEVLGQLGFWGILIKAVQTSIFDRKHFTNVVWDGQTRGYLIGLTFCLFLFYSATPLLLRMASAAFLTLSLMTIIVWDQLIFTQVLVYSGRFYESHSFGSLNIVALVLLIVGLLIYNCGKSFLGESQKPWLREDQENGIEGVGTVKSILAKERGA